MKTFLFVTSLLLANALLYAPSFGSFGGIGGGAPVQGICAQPEGADGVDKADLLEALERAAARSGEGPAGEPAPIPTVPDKPGVQDDLHVRHHGVPTPIPPLPDKGCANCEFLYDDIESYCMSKGEDCDGWFGWNESYLYERRMEFFVCPDGNRYVNCSEWGQTKCCNAGSAAPRPRCLYEGHITCP
jgi:hypothetical protein